jgi:hypothetical protein
MNQDAAYQKGMLAIESVADTAKFVTVFPNGINKGWDISGDRDIKFMKALIDEMITKYKINPNQVFLSGFSMGGMFTYHAMNRMPDKIAAFAPISGYPMGGTTANASVRPIPIIHTHGTGDDVVAFSGVQGALNAWINHNNCPKTAKVTRNYRGASGITRHVWGPGNDGVEVVLMELADKGHWISNDWGVKTGDEIWKFCKRYSLEMKDPMVRISAPQDGLTYVTIGGESEVPDIAMKATASDPDGQVVKVAFYDGDELLQEFDKGPYNLWVKGLKKGEHQRQLSKEFVREWLMDNGFQGKAGQQVPEMTDEIVNSISDRYIELYEHITGEKFHKADDCADVAARIEKNVSDYLATL